MHSSATPSRRHRWLTLTLVAALVAGACTGDDDDATSTSTTPTTAPNTTGGPPAGTASGALGESVLRVRLSQGSADDSDTSAQVTVVDGTALDDAAIAAVTDRLPDWELDPADAVAFNWPAQSAPTPRAGAAVTEPLGPPTASSAPDTTTGPLEVVRIQPTGDVAVAGFLTVTFNQPMVPVATVDQLDEADVPATITPAVEGNWRWIGTRTLRFDADSDLVDRLPMATTFTVTVPAGTESANGGRLAEAVTATFTTPAAQVISFEPQDISLGLEPVFLAVFDQRIDPAAVLATTTMTSDGDEVALRIATTAEIEADDLTAGRISQLPEGRWMAVRAVERLASDSALQIQIGPATPSAEGPLINDAPKTYRARTYPPLRVTRSECSWGPQCPPGSGFNVEFNNPIDIDLFDPASITISPALAGSRISSFGTFMSIEGATTAETDYTVTLPAALTDEFGQQLGEAKALEFSTGEIQPLLQGFPNPLVTVDPSAPPAVAVRSAGHTELKVTIYEATPADWSAFARFALDQVNSGTATEPNLPVLSSSTVKVADPSRLSETVIDLSSAIDGFGQAVVMVEPTRTFASTDDLYWQNRPAVVWAQATSFALDAAFTDDELLIWTTDLATGTPRPGVQVTISPSGQQLTTGADGIARARATGQVARFVGTSNGATTLLPFGYYEEGWTPTARTDQVAWYVTDDRSIYQPGETASLKGWVRRVTAQDGSLGLFGSRDPLRWKLIDAQGGELTSGTGELTPLGGFSIELTIPETANLGDAYLELEARAATGSTNAVTNHRLQIQQFRRPEFEVTARTTAAGPFVSSGSTTVAVDARYFAGGGLGAAPVNWSVTTSTASYSPPGWDGFSFGKWIPWWFGDRRGGFDDCCFPATETEVKTFTGSTDAAGTHYLQVDYEADDGKLPDLPTSVTAEAMVTDLNQQAWAGRTTYLVHPGNRYVGLRGARTFVREGEPLDIDAVVTDIDGVAIAGVALTVTAARQEWRYDKGTWSEQPVDPQTCQVTSAAEPVSCTFTTAVGGRYVVSSVVSDGSGGSSRTELDRWVAGGDAIPSRQVGDEGLTLIPEGSDYSPGDTVRVLVASPVSGHGLAVVTRSGIRSTITFEVTDGSGVIEIPVTDELIGGFELTVEVAGSLPRTADDGTALPDAPRRPAFGTAQLSIPVSSASRRLTVTATPDAAEVEPGTSTSITVAVKGSDGAAVSGAEVAVIVVDEAVLAVGGVELVDPMSVFYGPMYGYLQSIWGRSTVVLSDPKRMSTEGDSSTTLSQELRADETEASAEDSAAAISAPPPAAGDSDDAYSPVGNPIGVPGTGWAVGADGAPVTAIGERSDFNPLALFEPAVLTDANGTATVDLDLPDNLTRYRVIALAADGPDRFGFGESNLTARRAVMVRPSAPRFANYGDTFELPVLVQNQTDQAVEVDVVAQVANLSLTSGAGRRVSVPANDRVELRFPMSTDRAGTARVRIAGAASVGADAATVSFPVYTPATAEAFATYGVIDAGATVQPVLAPTGVINEFGGLDITTSSTSLQALTDAVLSIDTYRYESADAYSARILAITSLDDVLDAFDAPGLPSASVLKSRVESDLTALAALQNGDGGFAWWQVGRRSEPSVTVLAAHAMAVSDAAGYDPAALPAALDYLRSIEQHFPSEMSQAERRSLRAAALGVRSVAGDRDPSGALALWREAGDELGLDSLAWLWPVLDDRAASNEIERRFDNAAVLTADAATFATGVDDADYVVFRSDQRTDALALAALIEVRPDSDLIAPLVNGLLAGRKAGKWEAVHDNSAAIVALRAYYDAFESETPAFTAGAWLGDRQALDRRFQGRSTDRVTVTVPTAELIAAGDTDVVVGKQGTGRLYWRVGLRYAPSDLTLAASDQGFVVQRLYEAVDNPSDVRRDADGTWRIRSGARVRVRLTMVAESQRTHVALIDPLPAGLEILNPSLATTAELPADPDNPDGPIAFGWCIDWCWGTWFDHQNLRDDRAEAFSALLGGGTYDYSYVARATTSGTYVVPPARAEQVYAPETFGRTSTDRVIVE